MKWIIIIMLLSGCYNMRMNDYYGNLGQAYSDSMDCARKCHNSELVWKYYNKQRMYTDSMNYYYEKAHPGYREKEAKRWEMFLEHERQKKCNCK